MKKTVIIVLAIVLVGATLFGVYRLWSGNAALRREGAELAKKVEAMERRFSEQKNQVVNAGRAKTALEGQFRAALSEVERLKAENAAMAEEKGRTKDAAAAEIDALRSRLREAEERKAVLAKDLETLRDKHKKDVAALEEKLSGLSSRRDELERTLDARMKDLETCRGHNTRLSELSRELLDRYAKKGVLSAVAHKEPLLQVEKVELEKIVQEYGVKIGKENFKDKGKAGE